MAREALPFGRGGVVAVPATWLLRAVRLTDAAEALAVCQFLLERCPWLAGARDNDGFNVLHHAATRGDVQLFKTLVQGCPPALMAQTEPDTVAHIVVTQQPALIPALLAAVEHALDATDERDANAVHEGKQARARVLAQLLASALVVDAKHVVRTLVTEHQVDLNAEIDLPGGSPLLYAATASCSLDMVKLLCQLGANVNRQTGPARRNLLLAAAERGRCDLVQFCLSQGADLLMVDQAGHSPVMLAAAGGHQAVIETLTNNRLERLCAALQTQDLGTVAELSVHACGLDQPAGAVAPLEAALKAGALPLVEWLVAKGVPATSRRLVSICRLALDANDPAPAWRCMQLAVAQMQNKCTGARWADYAPGLAKAAELLATPEARSLLTTCVLAPAVWQQTVLPFLASKPADILVRRRRREKKKRKKEGGEEMMMMVR